MLRCQQTPPTSCKHEGSLTRRLKSPSSFQEQTLTTALPAFPGFPLRAAYPSRQYSGRLPIFWLHTFVFRIHLRMPGRVRARYQFYTESQMHAGLLPEGTPVGLRLYNQAKSKIRRYGPSPSLTMNEDYFLV